MKRTYPFLLAIAHLLWLPIAASAQEPPDTAWQEPLLKEDWSRLADTTARNDATVKHPVARLLMGHARLATRRDHEALVLFLSVTAQSDLARWTHMLKSNVIVMVGTGEIGFIRKVCT